MDELLDLLRSPVNEKKFTGLLLATKFLPAGDAGAIKAVHDAVGIAFIQRLLLSLSSSHAAPESQEQQEVRSASAGLGLAILAGFCRVPELAASQEIIQNVPLLLKVLRSSGIDAILNPGSSASQSTDTDAVHDALEALAAIASATEEGRLVCLQSGAIAAAATALQDAVTHPQLAALSVAFLVALLQGASRFELLSEQGEALSAAVPPMAALLAATSPEPQQQPRQKQHAAPAAAGASVSIQSLKAAADAAKQPLDAVSEEEMQEAAPGGNAGEPAAAALHPSAEQDAAAAQLEVLHALLLLLPPPEGSRLAQLLAQSAHTQGSNWPKDLRVGVASVLQSRAPPATRQAALVLTSAAVDLCGPSWLLGDAGMAKGVRSVLFYELVVEFAAIEAKVLLVDALRPAGPPAVDDTPSKPVAGPTVQQNAEQILPVAFHLLEAAVEVLASDADDGAAALDPRVADRALDTLNGAFEAILQFLEEVLAPGGVGDGPLALAALRALASYLADVPQAHAERVRKLLPSLLGVEGGAGRGGALAASCFLLPLLSQVAGPAAREAATLAGGSSSEMDAWASCIQRPQVVLALARTAAEAARSAPDAADAEDAAYTRSMLADLCALLLGPVSPQNHRNAAALEVDPGQDPQIAAAPQWLLHQEGAAQLAALSEAAAAVSTWWAAQQGQNLSGSAAVPDSGHIRLTMGAGALAAAVAALEPHEDAQLAAMPAVHALVSAGLELGLQVAIDLQRPPDITDDEDMVELVDQVLDMWHDIAISSAALASRQPAFKAALASQEWARQLAALPEQDLQQRLGASRDVASPVQRLVKALATAWGGLR